MHHSLWCKPIFLNAVADQPPLPVWVYIFRYGSMHADKQVYKTTCTNMNVLPLTLHKVCLLAFASWMHNGPLVSTSCRSNTSCGCCFMWCHERLLGGTWYRWNNETWNITAQNIFSCRLEQEAWLQSVWVVRVCVLCMSTMVKCN